MREDIRRIGDGLGAVSGVLQWDGEKRVEEYERMGNGGASAEVILWNDVYRIVE